MLIWLSEHVGGYLHDVFISRFDLWLALGLFGQILFAARFLVQWIASERQGHMVIPLAFWFFSIGGGLITLAYGLRQKEPVIILGQSMSVFIYLRNLYFMLRDRRAGALASAKPN
jgi:lipid-A-disaccharide synthase-like uncharacterized protein